MSNRNLFPRVLIGLGLLLLAGCANEAVTNAARTSMAGFLTNIFTAAVYEKIGP